MSQNEPFIIYKDKNFLAVYKPAGLLVHPIKLRIKNEELRKEDLALTDWLVENYPEVKSVGDPSTSSGQAPSTDSGQASQIRPGIVHRLDKDVSGILLVPRNQKYFEYLKNLFQTRQIKKNYLALVYGKIKEKTGIINKPISIKSGTIKRTVHHGKDEKGAITEYKVLKYLNLDGQDFSFVEVSPKTGRTHQIRIHLASIGHPIVGDALYGKKTNQFGLKRIFLHAESLEFSPEEGGRIKLEAELPDELTVLLKSGKLI